MEATAAYPQWPPVLLSTGLGGAIAALSPDRIPLQPVMVNDPRERARVGGVDCVGILRECHRNFAGYGFARPLKRTQLKGVHNAGAFARTEATYFDRHNREFVPRDVTVAFLQPEIARERESDVPKWQGNALLGMALSTTSHDHAVVFPTGQILQQARVLRNFSRDRKRQRVSNAVECGAVVRQFELLGSRATYDLYGASSVRIAARGAANCTILEVSFGGDSDQATDSLHALHRLRFDEMLYHIAGSPHAESDLAFVTGDGKLHTWDSIDGVQLVQMNTASVDERLLRCEYASHPCVLWTANRVRVQTLDLRDPQFTPVSLFDLVKMNAPHSEIYALKRRERAPFQLVVGTSVSVELLDSRMPGKALLSWQQRHEIDSNIAYFGALDEVLWGSSSGPDKGIILSSTQGRKTVSLYPFTRHDDTPTSAGSSPYLSIAPLWSSTGEHSPRAISQYIATDSPLDLQLRDGSDWTTLFGLCALADDANAASASVYQLSSMGDLFCQQIRPSTNGAMYETAVQTDLPCGVTAQHHPDDDEGTQLPLPADAIEGEYASDALTPFVALPLKSFMEAFPRLPAVHECVEDVQLETSHDIITALRRACRPSATLFRLHRFVNDELHLHVSSQTLLRGLRSHAEFSVRNGYHRLRQRVATVLDPFPAPFPSLEARVSKDERLATCFCCPQRAHEPCESVACVVPHALVVASSSDIHTELCFPSAQADEDACSDEYAAILEQAYNVYGLQGP